MGALIVGCNSTKIAIKRDRNGIECCLGASRHVTLLSTYPAVDVVMNLLKLTGERIKIAVVCIIHRVFELG